MAKRKKKTQRKKEIQTKKKGDRWCCCGSRYWGWAFIIVAAILILKNIGLIIGKVFIAIIFLVIGVYMLSRHKTH